VSTTTRAKAEKIAKSYGIRLHETHQPKGGYCVEISTFGSFFNLLDDHFLCLDQDNVELLEDNQRKVPIESTWEFVLMLLEQGVWECEADCFDCND
jgi:hypothetical protein